VNPAGTLIPPRHRRTLAENVVRALVIALISAAVLGVCWVLRFLALPLVAAILLVYVLGPLADLLENRGLPRSRAVTACFGLVVVLLLAVGLGTLPSLDAWLDQAPGSADEKSAFETQLTARLDGWEQELSVRYRGVDWKSHFETLRHVLEKQRKSLVEGLPTLALGVLSQAGSLGMALIIAFFVLLDGREMKKALVAKVPNAHFENALIMIHRVDKQISGYLIGTALENILVTILVAIPLFVLGMPNALVFAILFGVANVIPFAGPFIGASAGLLFSLLDPNAPGLGALVVVYFVVHMIDSMFISPLVMGKSLDMHPLTVIVGIFVGGTLGGIPGMLAAIPAIAVGKAIVTTIVEGVQNAQAGEG
jgi:predicted PurR-regulated permease PerM